MYSVSHIIWADVCVFNQVYVFYFKKKKSVNLKEAVKREKYDQSKQHFTKNSLSLLKQIFTYNIKQLCWQKLQDYHYQIFLETIKKVYLE